MKKTSTKIDNYLRQKIAHNDLEIYFNELEEIGLVHENKTIEINDNIILKRFQYFKSYEISFRDEKRNYDNKITDEFVDKKSVTNALSDYKMTSLKYKKFKENKQAEVEWTKDLENHLKKYFLTVRRGSPSKPLEIDIDLGSGKAGIELKWADKINKNNPMQSVHGQMNGYFRNGNYGVLFLVVAGTKELEQNALIIQLEKLVKKDFGCDFIYIKII
jgi:hypothetical protein